MTANPDLAADWTPDLAIARVLDAPRELMFEAWTDALEMAEWWGPCGFTMPLRQSGPEHEDTGQLERGVRQQAEPPDRRVMTSMPGTGAAARPFAQAHKRAEPVARSVPADA